jgi:hypothetical protein
MRCLVVICLYFIMQNASALPEELELCIWEADIAGVLQFGRQYKEYRDKDRLWHKEVVNILLKKQEQKPFVIRKILKIFDYVWDTFDITKTETFVFKETYTACIKSAKNTNYVYY